MDIPNYQPAVHASRAYQHLDVEHGHQTSGVESRLRLRVRPALIELERRMGMAVAWEGTSDDADIAFGFFGDLVVWSQDESTATTTGS